ncbi:MAG: DnaJ C-terminal domain-containing protein [Bowdeniella nasicola]|nr:DnaJ C-terminal domain-containing protein [Bowdeniella nasicola]
MSTQEWFDKDFYQTLGVAKDADASTIKKAYRKLARKYHPDQNPGDAEAEAKFKEIGEAYAVLSDPEQRKQYDAIRQMAGGGARFSAGPGGPGGAGFEDLFSGMFGGGGSNVRFETGGANPDLEDILSMFGGGGGARRDRGGFSPFGRYASGPERGADMHASTSLPFRQAAEGATVTLSIDGRSVTVRIPAGVRDGQKIRLRGKGHPGSHGGPNGDMVVAVSVQPHPVFEMDGKNLRLTLPVTFAEAALGATVEVPTLDGSTVRMKIPAGTPSGRSLRVKKRGIRTKSGVGDLLVTLEVQVPTQLNEEARAAIEKLREASDTDDPRAELRAQAQV